MRQKPYNVHDTYHMIRIGMKWAKMAFLHLKYIDRQIEINIYNVHIYVIL